VRESKHCAQLDLRLLDGIVETISRQEVETHVIFSHGPIGDDEDNPVNRIKTRARRRVSVIRNRFPSHPILGDRRSPVFIPPATPRESSIKSTHARAH